MTVEGDGGRTVEGGGRTMNGRRKGGERTVKGTAEGRWKGGERAVPYLYREPRNPTACERLRAHPELQVSFLTTSSYRTPGLGMLIWGFRGRGMAPPRAPRAPRGSPAPATHGRVHRLGWPWLTAAIHMEDATATVMLPQPPPSG